MRRSILGAAILATVIGGGMVAAQMPATPDPHAAHHPSAAAALAPAAGKPSDAPAPKSGMMGGGMMGGGMMGGRMGMMGGRGSSDQPPNGAALRVCKFSIAGKGPRLPIPRHLSPPEWRSPEEVVNRQNPRRFTVSMAMMRWVLNGAPFDMTGVAANERIKLGATEDWEFSNPGGMMTTAHPIHVHGGQFQIVQRTVAPAWSDVAATTSDGLIDDGWKDTFLLRPGEQVRIRVRFARHAGLFLYHCHNLEHEDMGMMRNFRVEG